MAVGDGVSAIASLGVGFGGFSPTAFDGVERSAKRIAKSKDAYERQREMARRRRELESARASEARRHVDADGSAWTYVVMDGEFARIDACEPRTASLVVPAEVEGLPVRAIGAEALAGLEGVVEIACPDDIEAIGSYAFRSCARLRRLVLPAATAEFSPSWVRHCHALEDLVLPGRLVAVDSGVFENEGLKRLRIGRDAQWVVPGAFEKTQLDSIEIDPENPYLATDGVGIYSRDGSVFIALARPLAHCDIAEGCEKIAKKAFGNARALASVAFPHTLEVIGKFAFAHSGLQSAALPGSVRVVGEKAFYHCKGLRSIELNEGLRRIDGSAFEESSLPSLRIPASINSIGTSIVAKTPVVVSGEQATIAIDPASESLFLDGSGGLYRRQPDGVHLIQLIDPDAEAFEAHPSTRVVDGSAFAFHGHIERAAFHEGLEEIGADAFRVCSRLGFVELPDSVRTIGADAFLDTALEEFRVPAALESLGENALVCAGAHHMGDPPSLRHVEVAPGNARFFMDSGLLCERAEAGVRVILYGGEEPDVAVADGVTAIAPYAFSNARGVRSISLPASLRIIGHSGLSLWSQVEGIHIELAEPVEGRTSFDFRFPATSRSIHGISLGLGGSAWVNVPDVMGHYDNCVVNAHDYNPRPGSDSIGAYEQVVLVLDRLRDPVLLTGVNRSMYDRLLKLNIEAICVDIARHDDRQAVDALIDLGYLNEENLERVIAAVGQLQDAAMTAYLLEAKRRRFHRAAFDFEL